MEALEDAVEQAAAAQGVDPHRPLGLLEHPDAEEVAHQEPLRADGIAL